MRYLYNTCLVFALLGTTCCKVVEDNPMTRYYSIEIPFDCLVNCRVFTTAEVFEGADYSSYACDLSLIYHSENNEELLVKLFNESIHLEGKAFALVALHSVNAEVYQECKSQLSGDDKITAQIYCLEIEMTLDELWEDIEKNDLIDDILV